MPTDWKIRRLRRAAEALLRTCPCRKDMSAFQTISGRGRHRRWDRPSWFFTDNRPPPSTVPRGVSKNARPKHTGRGHTALHMSFLPPENENKFLLTLNLFVTGNIAFFDSPLGGLFFAVTNTLFLLAFLTPIVLIVGFQVRIHSFSLLMTNMEISSATLDMSFISRYLCRYMFRYGLPLTWCRHHVLPAVPRLRQNKVATTSPRRVSIAAVGCAQRETARVWNCATPPTIPWEMTLVIPLVTYLAVVIRISLTIFLPC